MKNRLAFTLATSIFALVAAAPAFADAWYPYPAQAIEPAFSADGKMVTIGVDEDNKA